MTDNSVTQVAIPVRVCPSCSKDKLRGIFTPPNYRCADLLHSKSSYHVECQECGSRFDDWPKAQKALRRKLR